MKIKNPKTILELIHCVTSTSNGYPHHCDEYPKECITYIDDDTLKLMLLKKKNELQLLEQENRAGKLYKSALGYKAQIKFIDEIWGEELK